jgi:hypothetical protein
VPDQQEHPYDEPALTSKEFLYAVMRDPTLALGTRMDAACKLLELEANEPNYYGKYPVSRNVELTIRIAPINGQVSVEQTQASITRLTIRWTSARETTNKLEHSHDEHRK